MLLSNKSQISMEFVILVGFTIVFVMVLIVFSLSQLNDIYINKESILVRDQALKLQDEFNLASIVEDGYSRNFTIPQKLDTLEFSITIAGKFLTVKSDKGLYTVRIPEVNGDLTNGNNVIRKIGGIIYIN